MVSSGASNTALLEDENCAFANGGREAEAFDFGGDSAVILCVGNVGSWKEMQLVDWITCVWRPNRFERIMFPVVTEHLMARHAAAKLSSLKALSCSIVEEPANVDNVSETVSFSAGLASEADVETLAWRGTYCLPHSDKILFSQDVEIRTSELPRWKPRVIIDRHTP